MDLTTKHHNPSSAKGFAQRYAARKGEDVYVIEIPGGFRNGETQWRTALSDLTDIWGGKVIKVYEEGGGTRDFARRWFGQ